MKTHTKTIQELAKEVLDNMETKKRNDGKEFVSLKSHDIEWHVNLCREAHKDGMLPNDFVYEAINNALNVIVNEDTDNIDVLREAGQEIEPDVYTSDLLMWISDNLTFTAYADEAMEEYQPKDFVNCLLIANQLFKQDVFNSVLNSLEVQFNNQD